jgi:polyisoprenoid-binding protein YceI
MARYALDASSSRFTVQAFASGMLWAFAHNPMIAIRDFTGTLDFSRESPDKTALEIVVNPASMESTDSIRPADRQEIQDTMMEMLQVSTYPVVRYHSDSAGLTRISDSWFRLQFKGHLSLRGMTKPQNVDAQLTILDGEIRLSGSFTILQSAFGIARPSAVGGLIITKDELKFAFDIQGKQTEAPAGAPV